MIRAFLKETMFHIEAGFTMACFLKGIDRDKCCLEKFLTRFFLVGMVCYWYSGYFFRERCYSGNVLMIRAMFHIEAGFSIQACFLKGIDREKCCLEKLLSRVFVS